jgi:hypothetical protein
MHLDLRPFLILWLIEIAALIVVSFWRRAVAVQEDPALHLGAAHAGTAAEQIALAKKWVKILTVIAVVFGLLLGAAALYKAWVLGPAAGL